MSKSLRVRRANNGLSAFDPFDKMVTPLFRQSVGFERMFDTMNAALRESSTGSNYPPHNIVQTGDDNYTITIAVAGFTTDDVELKLENGVLTVTGSKTEQDGDPKITYLHRGIANRKFVHRFRLTEHIRVHGASLKDGMLDIELVREVPEALKPRIIEVSSN